MASCLHCDEELVPGMLVCLDHLREDEVLQWAAKYAVASILYYRHSCSPWTDAQFDGVAYALLEAKAWKRFPWLEREMLMAGSGYDLDKFPAEYHELAAELAQVNA